MTNLAMYSANCIEGYVFPDEDEWGLNNCPMPAAGFGQWAVASSGSASGFSAGLGKVWVAR